MFRSTVRQSKVNARRKKSDVRIAPEVKSRTSSVKAKRVTA